MDFQAYMKTHMQVSDWRNVDRLEDKEEFSELSNTVN